MSDGRLAIAAVRLGRLGDLIMTVPALRRLERAGLDVTLVTDGHHRELFARSLPEIRVLAEAAGHPEYAAILDLHGTPAARRVVRRLARPDTIVVRTRKDAAARRSLLRWGPVGTLLRRVGVGRTQRTWPRRHDEAALLLIARLGLRSPTPGSTPLPSLSLPSPRPSGRSPLLGLVPGARHASKRWPVARWQALARAWRSTTGGESVVVGAPWEAEIVEAIRREPSVRPGPAPLDALPGVLAACVAVVAGDTGPLHLAAALGVPVVALFGPTPIDAGFWVWGDSSRALVPGADCSPCSLHGSADCPRGRRVCLEEHGVDEVLRTVVEVSGVSALSVVAAVG